MGKAVGLLRRFFSKGDLLLLFLCLAASACGLVLIYSATRQPLNNRSAVMQLVSMVVGVFIYFGVAHIDIELLCEKSWKWLVAFEVVVILLLIPFGTGDVTTGNRNWIALPGLPANVQPAEFAKLAFILLLSFQCVKLHEYQVIHRVSSVLMLAGHTIVMCGLIGGISSDFGMVLVFLFLFVIIAFTAGVKLRWFALGLTGAGVGFTLLWPRLPTYIQMRLSVVLDHNLDPQKFGWQQGRSILAIGSGGLFGQGFLQGTQTQSGSIPVARTDEIFAVLGEEFGLVGCLVVMLLLFGIILRCIYISHTARSPMCAFTAMGFAGMLLLQTVFNIGMCLYIFPVVGLTLPFVSYGGSSVLALFAAMGIVSGIKKRPLPSWLKDRTQFR